MVVLGISDHGGYISYVTTNNTTIKLKELIKVMKI